MYLSVLGSQEPEAKSRAYACDDAITDTLISVRYLGIWVPALDLLSFVNSKCIGIGVLNVRPTIPLSSLSIKQQFALEF